MIPEKQRGLFYLCIQPETGSKAITGKFSFERAVNILFHSVTDAVGV